MGLEHTLACEQPTGHAEAGVAEQGGGHQQEAEGLGPAGGLKHQAGEHRTEEGVAHIAHEHLGGTPVPEQEAEQGAHKGPERPGSCERDGQGGDGHRHAAGHQAVEAIHEVGEVACGGPLVVRRNELRSEP